MAGEMRDQSNRVQASSAIPHVAVEVGEAQVLREKGAVDVWKSSQVFVQVLLALSGGVFSTLKRRAEVRPEVGAVWRVRSSM